MENHHVQWVNPLEMAIFNSYVKLPEGNVGFAFELQCASLFSLRKFNRYPYILYSHVFLLCDICYLHATSHVMILSFASDSHYSHCRKVHPSFQCVQDPEAQLEDLIDTLGIPLQDFDAKALVYNINHQ